MCKVYAYVPRDNNICKDSGIQCNDEFGISISRGSFTFSSGQYVIHILSSSYWLLLTHGRRWNRVTMLIRLNNPTDVANGQVIL